ncbi:MAG: PIN domain-containing protein [Thermoleophilia bacterium]
MHDDEFKQSSLTFFAQVEAGQFVLVTSAVVQDEMVAAPLAVRRFFDEMLGFAEVADITRSALDLRDAYLQAGIVTPRYSDDALHVALATVSGCTLIVSWNFQHIVHFQKIPLYNAMNTLQGYQQIAIFSPQEVIQYEDEEV